MVENNSDDYGVEDLVLLTDLNHEIIVSNLEHRYFPIKLL